MGKALYGDLVQGLTEAIAYEKGEGTAHTRTYPTEPASRILDQLETDNREQNEKNMRNNP